MTLMAGGQNLGQARGGALNCALTEKGKNEEGSAGQQQENRNLLAGKWCSARAEQATQFHLP